METVHGQKLYKLFSGNRVIIIIHFSKLGQMVGLP